MFGFFKVFSIFAKKNYSCYTPDTSLQPPLLIDLNGHLKGAIGTSGFRGPPLTSIIAHREVCEAMGIRWTAGALLSVQSVIHQQQRQQQQKRANKWTLNMLATRSAAESNIRNIRGTTTSRSCKLNIILNKN